MQGTFVLSTYRQKNQKQKRQVNFRHYTKLKYLALLLAILVVFGHQYCFDTASALQDPIEKNYEKNSPDPINPNKLGQSQFNLLYSLYAFPNVVIPLLGGMMIDKVGARIVLIVTALICVVGHCIYSFGGLKNIFAVMLVGRIVFGIGGEVLHAAQNTLISNWFKASELSLVLGICISFPKMGSSLNSVLSPIISKNFEDKEQQKQSDIYMNIGAPLFVGLGLMIFSFIISLLLGYIDRKTQKLEKTQHQSALLSSKSEQKINKSKKNMITSQIKSVRVSETSHIGGIGAHEKHQEGNQHLDFKAIKNLPSTFWILMLIAMLSEALFIPFLDNGNKYYITVFKGIQNPDDAGIYLILPYAVSSILVPVLGLIVDKVGRRSIVLIVSCGFILLTYIFMVFLQTSAELRGMQWIRWVPTALLGGCIAIFCTVIVPTVPMLVKPNLLGTGLGIMEVVQNLALGVFPLLAGAIRETQQHQSLLKGFHYQTLFFFVMACVCFSASIWLKVADLLTGNKLDVQDFRKEYVNKVLKQRDQ